MALPCSAEDAEASIEPQPRSFSAEDAVASITRTAAYTLRDPVVGSRVSKFHTSKFPIKSPIGLEFLAQNSWVREDICTVSKKILGRPHWGLIKIYSDALPPGYAFRLHNGSAGGIHTLIAQLWSPDTIVCFYEGSEKLYIEPEIETSQTTGLLATPRFGLNSKGISENIVKMKLGGLVLSDSRLLFTIFSGYVINVGFTTETELEHWAKMELPDSDELKKKVEELEGKGLPINHYWSSAWRETATNH